MTTGPAHPARRGRRRCGLGDVGGEQCVERVDLALHLVEAAQLATDVLGGEEHPGEDEQPDAGEPAGDEVGQLLGGECLSRDAVPPEEQREPAERGEHPAEDRPDRGPDPPPEQLPVGEVDRFAHRRLRAPGGPCRSRTAPRQPMNNNATPSATTAYSDSICPLVKPSRIPPRPPDCGAATCGGGAAPAAVPLPSWSPIDPGAPAATGPSPGPPDARGRPTVPKLPRSKLGSWP